MRMDNDFNGAWLTANVSDWVISVAYFSIPIQLLYFLYKTPVPLIRIQQLLMLMFASFICLCGLTHVFHASIALLKLYDDDAGSPDTESFETSHPAATIKSLEVTLLWTKVACAVVSLVTSIVLFLLIPLVIAHVRYVAELEEGVRRKIVELDEARDAAEQANRRKGDFMAFLCHEIRNPLHVITANIDFLLESSNMANVLTQPQGDEMTTMAPTDLAVLQQQQQHFLLQQQQLKLLENEMVTAANHQSSTGGGSPDPHTCPTATPALSDRFGSVGPDVTSPTSSLGSAKGTPGSTLAGTAMLFPIPSMPSSAAHSRQGSRIPMGITTAGGPLTASNFDVAMSGFHSLQTDPLLQSPHLQSFYTMTHSQTPSLAHGGTSSASTSIAAKRRTWPSVESSVSPYGPGSRVGGALNGTYLASLGPAPLSLEQKQYLKSINHAAELMVSICNDVLDIAKLESGVIEFEHLAVDLPLLCETFISLCQPQAAAKNIRLSLIWDVPPIESRYVFCDPTRLHQIFLQIISNSIKFSKETPDATKDDTTNPSSTATTPQLLKGDGEQSTAPDTCSTTNTPIAYPLSSTVSAFPDRLPRGTPGAGGQIQFRVRAWKPTAPDLPRQGSVRVAGGSHSNSPFDRTTADASPGSSAASYPLSPRMLELEQEARASLAAAAAASASAPSPGNDEARLAIAKSTPYAPFRPSAQGHHSRARSLAAATLAINAQLPAMKHVATTTAASGTGGAQYKSPGSGHSSSSSHSRRSAGGSAHSSSASQPSGTASHALNLANVFQQATPRTPATPSMQLTAQRPPPRNYGTRGTGSSGSGTNSSLDDSNPSSGHNTDGEDDTGEERARLILNGMGGSSSQIHSAGSSSSSPVVGPTMSPSVYTPSTPYAFDGYQQSHHISIASPPPPAGVAATGASTGQSPSPLPPGQPEYIWVEFLICDNGVGMSDAVLATLFTPYSESKLKTYRSKGGTGLGLSICKQVVTQLGGEMLVTSVEGEGSIFTVRLKLQVAQPEDVSSFDASTEFAGTAPVVNPSDSHTSTTGNTELARSPEDEMQSPPPSSHMTFHQHTHSSNLPSTTNVSSLGPVQEEVELGGFIGGSASSCSTRNSGSGWNIGSFQQSLAPPSTGTASSSAGASPAVSSPVGSPTVTAIIPALSLNSLLPPLSTVSQSGALTPAVSTPSTSTSAPSSARALPPHHPALLNIGAASPISPALRSVTAPSMSDLPLSASASPLTANSTLSYPPVQSPSRTPYRILVVDDNEINRKLLSRMMKSMGYEVDTAADGKLAFEAVVKNMAQYPPPPGVPLPPPMTLPMQRANSGSATTAGSNASSSVAVDDVKASPLSVAASLSEEDQRRLFEYEHNRYQIIIMDISMPVMDGYEATIAIRKVGFMSPIIALTANALTEERSKAFDAGFNEWCTKPIRKFELAALMKHFCGHEGLLNGSGSAGSGSSTPFGGQSPPVRQRTSPLNSTTSITTPASSTTPTSAPCAMPSSSAVSPSLTAVPLINPGGTQSFAAPITGASQLHVQQQFQQQTLGLGSPPAPPFARRGSGSRSSTERPSQIATAPNRGSGGELSTSLATDGAPRSGGGSGSGRGSGRGSGGAHHSRSSSSANIPLHSPPLRERKLSVSSNNGSLASPTSGSAALLHSPTGGSMNVRRAAMQQQAGGESTPSPRRAFASALTIDLLSSPPSSTSVSGPSAVSSGTNLISPRSAGPPGHKRARSRCAIVPDAGGDLMAAIAAQHAAELAAAAIAVAASSSPLASSSTEPLSALPEVGTTTTESVSTDAAGLPLAVAVSQADQPPALATDDVGSADHAAALSPSIIFEAAQP